jgi:hypothetical protein
MLRLAIGSFLSTLTLACVLSACGTGGPPALSPSSDDTCPLLDAGPPPVCLDGCVWNGTECRKGSGGVIIDDSNRRLPPKPLTPKPQPTGGVIIDDLTKPFPPPSPQPEPPKPKPEPPKPPPR